MISALTFFAFPKISTFARFTFEILTRTGPENLPKNVNFFGTGGGKGFPAQGVAGRRDRVADTEHCEGLPPGVQPRRPPGKPAQRRRTCPQQ